MTLDELNGDPLFDVAKRLRSACASRAWIEGMSASRPFDDLAEVLCEAERIWWALEEADWMEAFAAHPRIGDSPPIVTGDSAGPDAGPDASDDAAADFSRREQSGMAEASPGVRARLAAANKAYEQRFGFVYLVCATDKSAEEMLDQCLRRLGSEAHEELRVAGAEHVKITRLRLEKMLA
jgi:2-oxo-4-hydroxy-4-carboxy-5-ureidoimidazoline decarboxylase